MDDITLDTLHPKEKALLLALRHKFRFGNVVIVVRDGIPQYAERITERDNLDAVFDSPGAQV